MASSNNQTLVKASLSHKEDSNSQAVINGSSQQEPELLKAHEDKYDGVIVDLDNLHLDIAGFTSSLKASLSKWTREGKKGVWIKVPREHAKLVPAAIEEGFWYHHAESSHVMLAYWIPRSPCTLPANASHQVAIGAFVVNDKQEVLAVQEKNGPYKDSGLWKMPTGVIYQGEDIFAGAMREVKEETGIDAKFLEVVGIRHAHNALFGKSDLFFICMLQPLSNDIVVQESEISAAQWMRMEEFVAQPINQENELLRKMLDVCVASFEKRYKGFSAVKMASHSMGHPSVFYYNLKDMN
eukprot:Gb_28825 [translate_table: standard]